MLTIEDEIVLALRRISQAIDQYSRQLWRDSGLTAPQLATLREILAGESTTPMKLADALHVSQPTITGILGRLEQQGLIERKRSAEDRRSVVAEVTEKGLAVASQAPPLLRDRFRQELIKLPDWQQTELLGLLQKVAAMMHAPELTEGPFLFHDSKANGAQGAVQSNRVQSARKRAPRQKAAKKLDSSS